MCGCVSEWVCKYISTLWNSVCSVSQVSSVLTFGESIRTQQKKEKEDILHYFRLVSENELIRDLSTVLDQFIIHFSHWFYNTWTVLNWTVQYICGPENEAKVSKNASTYPGSVLYPFCSLILNTCSVSLQADFLILVQYVCGPVYYTPMFTDFLTSVSSVSLRAWQSCGTWS